MREFRLLPAGSGRGVSCDANGAFVDSIPLLKRTRANGKEVWEPRNREELSAELGTRYGLPIDVSSKANGIAVVAHALNEGAVARAQLATLHLQIPDPSPLAKAGLSRAEVVAFVRGLYESNLIKADWDTTKHPRWPKLAPDSQGGRFAPKGEDEPGQIGGNSAAGSASEEDTSQQGVNGFTQVALHSQSGLGCPAAAMAAVGMCGATAGAAVLCPETGVSCAAVPEAGQGCVAGAALALGVCHATNSETPEEREQRCQERLIWIWRRAGCWAGISERKHIEFVNSRLCCATGIASPAATAREE